MRRALPFLPLLVAGGCSRGDANTFVGFVDAPVSAVASEVPGQVVSVEVREGDPVKKGQVVARLDSREREAAVAQAEANVGRAQTSLQEADQNMKATLPTVKGAGADISRAEATLDDAQKSYDRTKLLFDKGAGVQADLDGADARLREAKAALDSLLASKDVASGRVGAAVAAVSDAQASVRSYQASLDLAKVQLAEASITAPFDGLVIDINLHPGEWAAPGTPVITLEDRSQLWVRIDVEETRFGDLKVGVPATVKAASFPGKSYKGQVLEVGAEGDFAVNRDVKRGRPDIRTFRVRVGIEEPAPELRPGMTAEVHLQ